MTGKLSPRYAGQTMIWWKAISISLPLLLALLLGSLLGLLAFQATAARADGWVIECVDFPKQFSEMTDRSLRLDGDGHPHIAYGEDHLYYAWHDGANWHYQTVDDSPSVGTHASLALDRDGYPHISYWNEMNGDLKYAYQDATSWHIQTVDTELGSWGGYTSLAVDGHGYPHISYCHCGISRPCDVGDLKYAYQDTAGWHIHIVDSHGSVGEYTFLALE